MARPLEALPLAEQAYRLANDHGLVALARQIEPILNAVHYDDPGKKAVAKFGR